VSLFDANGEVVEGVTNDNGVSVMFNNLFSGTYTYQVVNDGALSCGTMVEEHTVIRPTKMMVTTEVSADCGEGGQAVADVFATASGVEYAWSDGQTGPIATELPAGFYKLIVTNEFECKDTVEVEILAAPELQILATDGECDGSVNSAIELNCDDNTAHWDVNIRNANGNLVDFAYNVSLPMFFDILATGSYQVETELRGDWGCPPATQEVSVVQPVPMTLEATSEVQCDGDQLGTASTTMIGGVGYIQYQWSDGQMGPDAEGLQAGTYTVIATDEAGCSESVDVLVDLSPQMTVTPLSPGCEGEGETGFQLEGALGVTWTIQVTDNTGNTVETLTLPGGLAEITGMESGTYIVETSHDVADGCPAQQVEAQLIQPSDMTVETTTTPMQCGEVDAAAIELNVQGGSGAVTVTWDHGASGTSLSNLAGGQYYAVVEDSNGCTKDVRVEIEETPTVEANFEAPTGGLTDGFSGMTLTFTNTSEGNIEGQTWYFGDTDVPSYDYHATHTFEEAGAFDVFLNVWNEQCSHTVRKTVVVSHGETDPNDDELGAMVTHVMEGDLSVIPAPITTETGWMLDLGAVSSGMMVHVYDLTGRQLCNPAMADANGQIWVEGDEWPALVLLRLVHVPTNSIRTWKMVRQ
jgi:PKD repeat protein